MKNIFASEQTQLDDLLERVCEKLQITKTQKQRAETSYDALTDYLSGESSPLYDYDIDIYSQGSLRLGTTVKPRGREEYDLDLVCEVDMDARELQPTMLLRDVAAHLQNNQRYADIMEVYDRCVRLNYKGDFHMDILPCIPDPAKGGNSVLVPDRSIQNWTPSNPKDYAAWFDGKAKTRLVLERLAKQEPLPEEERVDVKPPLKLMVQLVKRYRDECFKNNPDDAPISIVLTTLAGTLYKYSESVSATLTDYLYQLEVLTYPGSLPLTVENPTNQLPDGEDFSERWKEEPRLYEVFGKWVRDFKSDWDELRGLNSLPLTVEKLSGMFGEKPVMLAYKSQLEYINEVHERENLQIQSVGKASLAIDTTGKSAPVRKHQFYGD